MLWVYKVYHRIFALLIQSDMIQTENGILYTTMTYPK